ncbi:hypothetical protein F4819DRAFT_460037 [Hypoxylon fuscum]|nr:hypothetical protein F4819DRAFT_460037 [Hypoxylon fuscum]
MASAAMTNVPVTGHSGSWDDVQFSRYSNKDYLKVTSACQELGDVLGICSETYNAVAGRVLADCSSTSIGEINVTIGFFQGDVACFLCHTSGGRKFFAIVCTLITAFDSSETAQVLETLMQLHLTREKGQYPTAEQLVPLILAIDGRCQLSGFSSLVVDYEIMLSRVRGYETVVPNRLGKTPDVEAVVMLIQLLLNLQAGGSGSRSPAVVEIHGYRCVPWIAAFLRWWYRKQSLIYLEEDMPERNETFTTSETDISIKLKIPTSDSAPESVKIRARYSETEFNDYNFGLGRADHYLGLVSIETFFRLMLSAFKLDRGQANKAALEVIPYALSKARRALTMCSEGCVSPDSWGKACEITQSIESKKSRLWQQPEPSGANRLNVSPDRFEPFPERAEINSILQRVRGLENGHMQDLFNSKGNLGNSIWEHREASVFLEHEVHAAERVEWERGFRSQFTPLDAPGATTQFSEQMAHIVATILALSLFRDPEQLLVRPDPFLWQFPELRPSTIISAISNIFSGKEGCCDVMEWHRVCRKLAGAQPEEAQGQPKRDAVVSCYAGQAMWPAITFACRIPGCDESYLRLLWRRGNLYQVPTWNRYRLIAGYDSRTPPAALPTGPDPALAPAGPLAPHAAAGNPITFEAGLLNLCDTELSCSLVRRRADATPPTFADPNGVLKCLAAAQRLAACPHKPDAPLVVHPHNAALRLCAPEDARPWCWDHVREGAEDGAVVAVPVAGDERARFFALAKPVGAHVAVRVGACAECCVRFCAGVGVRILVL